MRNRKKIFVASLGLVTLGFIASLSLPTASSAMAAPNAKTAADTIGERIHGRLDERHKKACEARSAAVKIIMQRAALQGQKNLDVFSKIATRIEQFYVSKNLNANNYDLLLTAVAAKKAAATATIATVKNASGTFSCSSDDPVGHVDQFKKELETMRLALKDYRLAINDLITAVKAAAEKGGSQ